jgi:hypothetical protein
METERINRFYNSFSVIILTLGIILLITTATYTTYEFMQLERETTRNKVAALLLERQQILNSLRITPGLETNYKSYTDEKRIYHPYENLYNHFEGAP